MTFRRLVVRTAVLAAMAAAPLAYSAVQAPAANADVISDCTNFYYGFGYGSGLEISNSPNCPAYIWI